MPVEVTRQQVLGFRVRAQQLDRSDTPLADAAVCDAGVQDTGPDGALWALAIRGVDVSDLAHDDVVVLWTIRGAPHLYRRADLPSVAGAVQPYSEEDAAKRIFDAAKPLKAAGIPVLDAVEGIAAEMRKIVTAPMVKGEVSTEITKRMDEAYLRYCRSCQATHLYELPFRLGATRAGLELRPRTSPPVLQPMPGFVPTGRPDGRHDVIRGYLRLLGPATHKQVAEYLDSKVMEVKAYWPGDTAEVTVDGERRWILESDESALAADMPRLTRLLGPYDLFLQAKDRSLLVPDAARAKALWPVLGRPGAVLIDGEIAGWWRPRKSGAKLKVAVDLWAPVPAVRKREIEHEAERLAAFREVRLAAVDVNIS
jgi:hypothetical protein